jgi:tRNA pseudouridine55 synthase
MDGVLNIDKAAGMTSHDVVQAVRKRLNVAKVGHLGTLDPMATGVLPLSVGKATRIAQFIPNSPKEYEGEIRFGFATNTYDREGTATGEVRPLQGNVAVAMRSLTGTIEQIPPPFSAKKIGGVPAYKMARRQQPIEIKPVRVEIRAFEMLALAPPLMKFRVVCSPGTYVRSLAHDLGQRLGCGAHLTALRRIVSGEFRIQDAVALSELSVRHLIRMEQLLPSLPRISVSESDETKIVHGNPVAAPGVAGLARIFNKRDQFIAVAAVENGWAHPRTVLTSITSGRSAMIGCILEKENES